MDVDLHNIIACFLILSFSCGIAAGVIASAHVDERKLRNAQKPIQSWGPLVTGSILTAQGAKWARIRNFAVTCFGGVGVVYAIVMSLLQT